MDRRTRRIVRIGLVGVALLGAAAARAEDTAPQAPGSGEILVTPETIQWKAGPASLPPGAQLAVLEGDPAQPGPFTIRLKFPAHYQVRPHWHPAPERVTVLSGMLHLGFGDTFDETNDMALPAGSYRVTPAGVHHFGWTSEETVLQLHGTGPWELHYLNPSDDAREPQ